MEIKAIIGLGNPGSKFFYTRHNIGFRVLDALADLQNALWQKSDNLEYASTSIDNQNVLLVKPQTFMNDSGLIYPFLNKKGIKAENILVVHDELEVEFGKIKLRQGGSARGHNGLKSIISFFGADFWRLRVGISRPEDRSEVANYVLQKFRESDADVDIVINQAVNQIVIMFDLSA